MNLYREDAKTCSPACRKRASRQKLPPALTSRDRWVRWTPVLRGQKMTKKPIRVSGQAASSTDPDTWSSYAEARRSTAGSGLGFVLNGDGIGCVDLDGVLADGVLDPRAAEFLNALDSFYVEVSPSGAGIHAWVEGGSPDGRKVFTLDNGLKVEWYSDGRYLTMTGRPFSR